MTPLAFTAAKSAHVLQLTTISSVFLSLMGTPVLSDAFLPFPPVFSQPRTSYTKSVRVTAKDVICAPLGPLPNPSVSAYHRPSGHKELVLILEFNRKMKQNNRVQNQCKTM